MTSKIDEQVQTYNDANSALIIICSNMVGALTEIGRLKPWNPLSLLRAKRIARVALDQRTVQLRRP
jgi:hypothetical protein